MKFEKLNDIFDLCALFIVFVFYGLILFLKLIKAWGWIPIFFGHVWNFQNFDQIWTLGPSIYYKDTFKHTRRSQIIFKKCDFCKSEN